MSSISDATIATQAKTQSIENSVLAVQQDFTSRLESMFSQFRASLAAQLEQAVSRFPGSVPSPASASLSVPASAPTFSASAPSAVVPIAHPEAASVALTSASAPSAAVPAPDRSATPEPVIMDQGRDLNSLRPKRPRETDAAQSTSTGALEPVSASVSTASADSSVVSPSPLSESVVSSADGQAKSSPGKPKEPKRSRTAANSKQQLSGKFGSPRAQAMSARDSSRQ
jgi:hypothetical protein